MTALTDKHRDALTALRLGMVERWDRIQELEAENGRLRGALIDILWRWDTAKPWWPDKVDTDRELYEAANAALKPPTAP